VPGAWHAAPAISTQNHNAGMRKNAQAPGSYKMLRCVCPRELGNIALM